MIWVTHISTVQFNMIFIHTSIDLSETRPISQENVKSQTNNSPLYNFLNETIIQLVNTLIASQLSMWHSNDEISTLTAVI